MLKMNISVLLSQYESLRKDSLVASADAKKYSDRMQSIQAKLAPKVSKPKPQPRVTPTSMGDSSEMNKERAKHGELANEMLRLSEQLKSNVADLSIAHAEDAEVQRTVQDSVECISTGSEKNKKEFGTAVSESLGWKVYYWLVIVIIVYILVTFLFL